MARIALVTGGAGFLGSHLAGRLGAEGWEVRILDLIPPAVPAVTYVAADVRDRDAVVAAADGCDVVFHMASIVGVEPLLADPVAVADVAVNGTLHALDAAALTGAALVHLSTSEVLGLNATLPWAEDANRVIGSAATDRWAYASAKATAEHVVLAGAERRGVAATVVRPFNVYGPGQAPRFVVPLMVEAALDGRPIPVHGDGTQRRCFTYVDDVVDALLRIGEKPGVAPVVHLGSTEETSILELAHLVVELAGVTTAIEMDDPCDRWGQRFQDVPRRVPDCSLALTAWGWSVSTALSDGLEATIEASRRGRAASAR